MKKILKDICDWICPSCGKDNRDCKCGFIQY